MPENPTIDQPISQLYREELTKLGIEQRELEAQILELQAKLRFNDKKQQLFSGLLEAEAESVSND